MARERKMVIAIATLLLTARIASADPVVSTYGGEALWRKCTGNGNWGWCFGYVAGAADWVTCGQQAAWLGLHPGRQPTITPSQAARFQNFQLYSIDVEEHVGRNDFNVSQWEGWVDLG